MKDYAFLTGKYAITKSQYFEKILHDIEDKAAGWTMKKMYDEIIQLYEPEISFSAFENWFRQWKKFKDEQVKIITGSILERAAEKRLQEEQFRTIIDQLFLDKLTPDEIAKLSLKDVAKIRVDVSKLTQEDSKIELKKKEDKRADTMFGLSLAQALSGELTEEELDESNTIDTTATVVTESSEGA